MNWYKKAKREEEIKEAGIRDWMGQAALGLSTMLPFGANALDYTVQSGDNLSNIALQHNVSVDEIQQANPQIENVNEIFVGQNIKIPTQEQEAPQSEVQEEGEQESFHEQLIRHEGFREYAYDDATGKRIQPGTGVEGIPTIGVGFNLYRNDAQEVLQLSDQDLQRVLNGEIPVDNDILMNAFYITLEEARDQSMQYVDNFEQLHPDAQEILTNMMFNMGWKTMGKFKNFRAALNRGDYQTAALEMTYKDSRDPSRGYSSWYNQVGDRAVELIEKMNSIPQN